MAVITWLRRKAPGAYALLALQIGALIWSLTYAAFWAATTPAAQDFWLNATYLGVVITPVAFFMFVLRITQRIQKYTFLRLAPFLIIPILTTILLWTDPIHNLFFGGLRTPGQSTIFHGGPIFWVNIFYSYGLIVVSIFLLWNTAIRQHHLYRTQVTFALIGSLFPPISNAVTFAGLNPFPNLDLTPFAFTFSSVFLALSLVRYRMLDLVPVGRDILVERMSEGMLLLDRQGRIADLNPAARHLLDLPAKGTIGKPPGEALAPHTALLDLINEKSTAARILSLNTQPPRHIEVHITAVEEPDARVRGTLVICRDVTAQVEAEQSILDTNDRLRQQITQNEALQNSLREQAFRDSLTSLYNRRYLDESLARDLASADRARQPLSLVMLDIDHFKKLNDTHGHAAGDLVLQRLSSLLTSMTRAEDVLARYGGEEFMIAMLNTTPEVAAARAEDWRVACQELTTVYEGKALHITISAGVASFPQHTTEPGTLIRLTDAALYQAKDAGRNCVIIYSPSGSDGMIHIFSKY